MRAAPGRLQRSRYRGLPAGSVGTARRFPEKTFAIYRNCLSRNVACYRPQDHNGLLLPVPRSLWRRVLASALKDYDTNNPHSSQPVVAARERWARFFLEQGELAPAQQAF